MAGSSLYYLADSNILLRLTKRDHPQYPLMRSAVHALRQKGMTPAYTLQNMTEFWNASTRPTERNGFGLTVAETERNARVIERGFTFLADTEAVYREWRRIVVQYGVSGVQVHDARLAAAMYAHGVSEILTLNGSDFIRFAGIAAIDPHHI
jgi:predicted nucleic acid-binding protein